MKLVLQIAAGIVLGFSILWVANVGFAVLAISSFSSAMSQMLSTKKTNEPYPQAKIPTYQTAPLAQITTTKTRPRKLIIGYKEKRIAGRPLKECLGPNQELNANVLRCRNGYMTKIPIYNR